MFHRNLLRQRLAKRLTQRQLADKAEISIRYVQDMESGKKSPTLRIAARLRTSLGCKWADLLRGV